MSLSNRLIRSKSMRVRAPRVPFDLEVESRTIGSPSAYRLSTLDISRSGLLLAWNRRGNVPFVVNTILEMTIDPKGRCFGGPVTCLGKVVRRESRCREETKLGIQIVQIDNLELRNWEGYLTNLEKKFGIEMSVRLNALTGASNSAA